MKGYYVLFDNSLFCDCAGINNSIDVQKSMKERNQNELPIALNNMN